MRKIFILLLSLMVLSGCYNAPNPVKPMSWLFKQMPEDAPNNYKRAWIDGCESGLSNMTNTMYKTFYSFKMDPVLRKNALYYKIWQDTYNFCRHYAYGTIRETNQRMNLSNRRPQFMEQFMGAEGIFEAGMLRMWGPGDAITPLGQFGDVSGDLGDSLGMQGTMDFTDDSVMNGKRGGMDWNFGY